MRSFQFRLQTKLDLASREEEQVREELAVLIMQRDKIQQELEEIKRKLGETEESIKELMLKGFSLEQFLIIKDYLPIIREAIFNKSMELHHAEAEIVETRYRLLEKMKERKILEKLREKEWANYQLEMNREEQKTIDEVAINNHFRK